MNNTKRCFTLFSFYDRTGIEAYLEEQAKKGWMLDKISSLGWHFHRIEPKKMHFSVVYFSKASSFDPEPSEGQLAFQDFCEHTGWNLAASNAQMQIFYNEAEEPTPIETDAALELSAIHESAKKSHLSTYYILAICGLLNGGLFLLRWISDPIDVLANNAALISGVCWVLTLALSVVEIVGYYSWYKRAKNAANLDGSFVKTKGHRNFQVAIVCCMLLAFAFLLFSYAGSKIGMFALASIIGIIGVAAMIVGISTFMKKMKISAKRNRNITIILSLVIPIAFAGILFVNLIDNIRFFLPEKTPVDTYEFHGRTYNIYHDELPLTIEDLMETAYDGYSYELSTPKESIFVKQQEAIQRTRWDALEQPELEYSITTVKVPLLYEWCKTALLDDFAHNYAISVVEHVEIDAVPWGANEAYQLKLDGELQMRFLLCYDNCIVEIDFEHDWELTSEQKQIVAEKLDLR